MRSSSAHTSAARTEIQSGLWLDPRLALWIAAERLLVIADLHWGFAASHRAQGNLLPYWGDDEIARRLNELVLDYHPAEMLWLGDIVHTAAGAAAAEQFLRAVSVPVTLLAGNHDRKWSGVQERTATRGRFFFHHGDREESIPAGCVEVVGHHHPAIDWWDGAGGRLKIPALVSSPHRLILPAFSPWAVGTPWNSQVLDGETLWAVSPHRIFTMRLPRAASKVAAV